MPILETHLLNLGKAPLKLLEIALEVLEQSTGNLNRLQLSNSYVFDSYTMGQ